MDLNKVYLENEDYILPRYQTLLKKKGIETINDLLYNFPIKYEDYIVSSINNAKLDEIITLEGTVSSKVVVNYLKTKLSTVVFNMEVDGRIIRCTIFNRVYLKSKINYGSVLRVQGHFYQNLNSFTVNNIMICDELNRNIVPIYHIKDIALDKYLAIVEKAYRRYKSFLVETLPSDLKNKHDLCGITDAVKYLHFSDNYDDINKALKRIKYEELLNYQLSMRYAHYKRKQDTSCPVINYNEDYLSKLTSIIPYELTLDQKNAINDILTDLKATYSMNRLLQGEVGSGKTIIACFALLACCSGGFQGVLMCPTEILSQQHYESLTNLFKDFKDIHIELLTGSTPQTKRSKILEEIKDGSVNIVIGTHALFQSDVEYAKLGLVVTDEEHRFGVHQRVLIKNKGTYVNYLKMSATPIPRTLAISAYGDMDISVIKTMPLNRKQVITKVIDESHKQDVIDHMKKELDLHHQIYVVTPLIEESDSIDTANAEETYEKMINYFKGIASVGLIHGKLPSEEKESIMQDFLNNKIQILVATSVIEVGVNVKNATTIVILGAERFGVATLHQLRGRVMRSSEVPYCFLIPYNLTDNAKERLNMVENISDGFELAEYDLLNRGPGEFFGEKQAGSMNFKYADLLIDKDLLHTALEDSSIILNSSDLFNNPEYEFLLNTCLTNYEMKLTKID